MTDSPALSPLDAFSGRMEPTRVSWLYQAGLAIVALAMILLPLIYLALIAAVGWAVWWHLVNDVVIFQHVEGRGVILALVAYLGPAVAGVIFVLFLIKPLFSRASQGPPPFQLSEKAEPLLFAFVEKICQHVGAPVPREIRLDTQVNASAGFRRGWVSFLGSDLVLVIGAPLVAGMSMRQLAGVLAHEFGHFAQGAGMRLSYIIRSVNAWFARVVYERDHWDERLEGWAQTDEWYLKIVFLLAKGGVWAGRKILWLLMSVGHAISCFMSRQMEFDADSYEAKLAGSSEFARTAERLRALGVAHGVAMNDAYQTFQSRELPDDLTALVAWREKVMPAHVRQKLEQSVSESKTAWNHTHPADSDRVKAALAIGAEGVFRLEEPAAGLFKDFNTTSRDLTRHYFQHELQVSLDKVRFRDAARMAQDRQAADESDRHLDTFYLNLFHFMRVTPLEPGRQGAWKEAHDAMLAHAKAYEAMLPAYHTLLGKLTDQTAGADLIAAHYTLTTPGEFGLSGSTAAVAEAGLSQTRNQLRELAERMAPFETATTNRLRAALDDWRDRHGDDPGQSAQLERLLAAQRPLARITGEIMEASRASRSLELIFANSSGHQNGEKLYFHARTVAQRIETAFRECMTALENTAHPYLDGHPPVSGTLHVPEKADNEYARAVKLAQIGTEALIPLLVRIMGDLSGLALAAEKELAQDTARFQPPPAGVA